VSLKEFKEKNSELNMKLNQICESDKDQKSKISMYAEQMVVKD
jgi:hypothetical protein